MAAADVRLPNTERNANEKLSPLNPKQVDKTQENAVHSVVIGIVK